MCSHNITPVVFVLLSKGIFKGKWLFVFVIGQTGENEVRISARSDGVINVQLLCEKMGGGGHFGMAAAAFKDKTTDDVEKILLDTLDNYLDEATNNKAEE